MDICATSDDMNGGSEGSGAIGDLNEAGIGDVEFSQQTPRSNHLLDGLSRRESQQFFARCEQIELFFGDILCHADDPVQYAYFPLGSFISLVSAVDGHDGLALSLIGCEGMVGVPLVLGVGTSTFRATVQGRGSALRINAAAFRRELDSIPSLRRRLDRYIHVLLAQFAQMAACTRFHPLDARLARWLLTTQDRARSNEFHLTHELLAQMLGVRRVGVTNAAGIMQRQGLLSYTRGEITVLDRHGLENMSCGCYRIAQHTYDKELGQELE
jgi:CRP-like cAMP-binding protein